MSKHDQLALKAFGNLAIFMGLKYLFIISITRYARRKLNQIESEQKRNHHIAPSNADR